MTIKRVGQLIISILIALTAGFIGSLSTFSAIPTWYRDLNKPLFTPPNWLFGPVWTILYILMGWGMFLVWEKREHRLSLYSKARNWYLTQLVLNVLWSVIFFGLHLPWIAFLEIIFLWISILKTIIYFKQVSPQAAYFLYPYISWVTFASALNLGVALLN